MNGKKPDYYDEFTCIGSRCKDNCCIGWEIDIDENALNFYGQVKGNMAERLTEGISMDPVPHFNTNEKGRCVFLNHENLCDLYIELGEDSLCEICTEHPRFFHDFGEIQEKGLGIACEEAARLILNRTKPVRFLDYGPPSSDNTVCFILSVRENLVSILQNRSLRMEKRMAQILEYGWQAQQWMNTTNITQESTKDIILSEGDIRFRALSSAQSKEFWPSFYQNLDIMDEQWQKNLQKAATISDMGHFKDSIFWEQLCIYFIFRHLIAASDDFNLYGKVQFCVLSCLIIRWILDIFPEEKRNVNRLNTAKQYSKEIEYSEENLQAVWEELLFNS